VVEKVKAFSLWEKLLAISPGNNIFENNSKTGKS